MPVLAIYRRDDVSAETYEKYRAHAPLDTVPKGALAHAYGRTGAGFVGVDVWETRAALEAYIQDVVLPACDAIGVAYERPEVIELTTFLTTETASRYVVPFTGDTA